MAADPGSRAATIVMLARVTRSLGAGGAAFDVARTRGSRLRESICAGRITDAAMVTTVRATHAKPRFARGVDGWYARRTMFGGPGIPAWSILSNSFKLLSMLNPLGRKYYCYSVP